MLNFVYLRSSTLIFWHFCLDSCIVNELEMACCTHLEGFQVASSYFWALAVSQVASAWPVKGTVLTGEGHGSDRCSSQVLGDLVHWSDQWVWPVWPVRAKLMQLLCSWGGSHAPIQGESHWFRGSLHVCKGRSLWFSSFAWWFVHFAWAEFCLRCVESLPLPKGSETCLL
jgi:hypothetical protein